MRGRARLASRHGQHKDEGARAPERRPISARAAAVLALAAALHAGPAAAEPATKSAAPADANERYDADNVTAISRYMETVAKGNARWVAKDPAGAIDAYRSAIPLSPRDPLAHFLLASAYLATGKATDAEASIDQAVDVLGAKSAPLRGRVLFLRAEVLERQQKWEPAKAAWQAYAEHAAKEPGRGAFPQTAAARIKALQRVIDLDRAYAGVRERIAAEKAKK